MPWIIDERAEFPNVNELHGLIHFGYYYPALPNTEGTGQWTEGDPFTGVQSWYYWSSSTYVVSTGSAWYVNLGYGDVDDVSKAANYCVWPVRDRP